MDEHDPLCPWGKGEWPDNRNQCQCDLIARARADERAQFRLYYGIPEWIPRSSDEPR